MRIIARCGAALLCAVAAGCTVERAPDTGAPPPASAGGTSSPTARACPWSEERGQEYEPETGRIRLVVACLGEAHVPGAGSGYLYSGPDPERSGGQRYADGTTAAVLCVEPAGARFADSAGHPSTVWFRVEGSFAAGDAAGWVPHAATGYARTAGQDPC